MGRRILGVFVGWLCSTVAISILFVLFALVLGEGGMVGQDGVPTQTWLFISLALYIVAGYLAGAIARAIGKDRQTIFIYFGVAVFFGLVSILWRTFAQAPEPQPIPEETPQWARTLAVMGQSFQDMPSWFMYAVTLLNLVGVCLGGLDKGDFAKPAPQPPGQ